MMNEGNAKDPKKTINKCWEIIQSNSIILKVVLVLVLFAFLAVVYNRANARDVSLTDVYGQFKSKTDIENMAVCDERDLKEFIGLDYTEYDSFIYCKSKEALGVDEVLIVKAKQRGDLDAVQDAVDSRIDSQEEAFESYGPKQVRMLKNAVVTKKGNYLFYCVAKDPEKYEEVFKNAV